MTFDVEFTPAALRELKKLPREVQSRIVAAAEALADNPRPDGCRKLAGGKNEYRIRIGDYRIIYRVNDPDPLVLVLKVGHRRDVYR